MNYSENRKKIIISLTAALCLSFLIYFFLNRPAEPNEEEAGLYAKALTAYESADFALCIQLSEALFKGNPSFYQAGLLKSKAQFFCMDYREAKITLNKLLRRKGNYYEAEIWLIRCLIQQNNLEAAEARCADLHSRAPEDPRLLNIMAGLSELKKNYRSAIEYRRRAILFEEETAINRIELAKIYFSLHNIDLAQENIQKASLFLEENSPLKSALLQLQDRLEAY